MAKSRLHELAARGQSIWFDTLSRDLVHTGELKRMMDEDAVTGVTSNPTIFQKALSSGSAYDEDMKKLLGETDDPEQIFFSLDRYKAVVEAYLRGLERLIAGGGDPSKVAFKKAETSSRASDGPTTSEPRQSTFMSSCSTPWWAEYASWQIAARTPVSLQAATDAPTPEPHTRTARSASPRWIASPTSRALSG